MNTMNDTARGRSLPAWSASWRLTRRGRLVVTSAMLLVLVLALVVATGGGQARGESGPRMSVVVQEGQTLDELAATYLPHTPRFEAVQRINRENRLNSDHVQAGRTILIPAE